MLLRALYDFTPRTDDSHQTLGFKTGNLLLFIEVYPEDSNWFRVADTNGKIGYIPKNYVKLNDDQSREIILQFLLEAIYKAKKDKLPTLEKLEFLKEQSTRKDYRTFQIHLLTQAMQRNDEIEDTETTYTCDNQSYHIEQDDSSSQGQPQSEQISSKTAPVKVNPDIGDQISSKTYGVQQRPVTTRASKSCPQPSKTIHTTTQDHFHPENRHAAGDARNKGPSTTRIPVRTSTPVKGPQKYHYAYGKSSQLNTNNTSTTSTRPFSSRDDEEEWEQMASKLIQVVQESRNFESEVVVHRLLHHLQEHLNPNMPEKVGSILRVLESSSTSLQAFPGEDTESTRKVRSILRYLSTLDKPSNRSHIPEESTISRKLSELREELLNMDSKLVKHCLQSDHYQCLHDLVAIYEGENRIQIKSKLLDIFSMISTLDPTSRSTLLRSLLPITLAKEMYENEGSPGKLSRLANTLVSLMSSGEPMPPPHFDELGSKFTTFLFNYLEDTAQQRSEQVEQTKSDFFHLLLAYNLQFSCKDENLLTKTLAGRQPARYFMHALMTLFECGEDPIKGANLPPDVPHSVLKLMKDLFSSKITAEHFHTADMKWLTDLIYKDVTELGPGETRRTECLDLLWLVLRNRAFQYRIKDIKEGLFAILLEEDALSIPDQRIVKAMSKEFSALFKKGSSSTMMIGGGAGGFSHNLSRSAF